MSSHYLNQCWNIDNWTLRNKLQRKRTWNLYIFIQENAFENVVWWMPAILSRPQCVNLLRPEQNDCHFAEGIFWLIFLNVLIQIMLRFVTKGPIHNKSSLLQVMAWRWTGNKALPEPMTNLLMPYVITRPQWVDFPSCDYALEFNGSIFKFSKVWLSPKIWGKSQFMMHGRGSPL